MITATIIVLATAASVVTAWVANTCGYYRGLKRGADLQRVADIVEQWRAKDMRNQCGRFRRTGRN